MYPSHESSNWCKTNPGIKLGKHNVALDWLDTWLGKIQSHLAHPRRQNSNIFYSKNQWKYIPEAWRRVYSDNGLFVSPEQRHNTAWCLSMLIHPSNWFHKAHACAFSEKKIINNVLNSLLQKLCEI